MRRFISIVLCLAIAFAFTACTFKETASAVKPESTEKAADGIDNTKSSETVQYPSEPVFDPDEVQYAYNEIIDGILAEMESNIPDKESRDYWISMSRGSIFDNFGTGVNQMLLTYTPDGKNLKAGIYMLDKNSRLMELTVDVAVLAGAASCEVIPGTYRNEPAVFVLYTDSEGEKLIGELKGYDVSGDEIECVYSQRIEGADGLKTISAEGDVYLGATACSFGENGTGKVINTLQAT